MYDVVKTVRLSVPVTGTQLVYVEIPDGMNNEQAIEKITNDIMNDLENVSWGNSEITGMNCDSDDIQNVLNDMAANEGLYQ